MCVDMTGAAGDNNENALAGESSANAFAADPLFATKILFYARDIREGLGERKVFRTLLRYAADRHLEAVLPNLDLVGAFGRYDDLYCLVGTKLEDAMWAAMKRQFEKDMKDMEAGDEISLLAKWIKTADASSKATRDLGILTALKLGYSIYDFKRVVRSMRKYIGVKESLMAQNRWDEIDYSSVPRRTMKVCHKSFQRHNADRFEKYMGSKDRPAMEKLMSAAPFPHDVVCTYMRNMWGMEHVRHSLWIAEHVRNMSNEEIISFCRWESGEVEIKNKFALREDKVLEAQWRALSKTNLRQKRCRARLSP